MRTYGTLALKGDTWHIDAEPHVVLRLKRIFGKLSKGAKALSIRHTPDTARDLEWVLERYPLEVAANDLDYLKNGSRIHTERAERFVKVLSGEADPRSFELKIPPRDYQRVAADLALQQGGLLIADDVGVGKTASAICMLTDPNTRPALVVTLTHLPRQWANEIARFAPRIRTHILKKGTPYPLPEVDVLITNYHKLSGWAPALAGTMRTIIFDEVQELRHSDTNRYTAAKEIATGCTYRIGLSATPIHNYGDEFFSVINVLQPDALGTKSEFVTEWGGSTDSRGKTKIADPKAFGSFLRDQGLMLRRTRRDVGRELPGLSVVPHTVASDDVFETLGEGAAELARFILSQSGAGIEQMQARGDLDWQLRQATGLAKARYVAEFVRMLVDSGERVLLYGWHHAVYDVWCDKLADLGVAKFTGEQSANQKEEAARRFKEGEANVLVMSLRAGAGLDGLQHHCRTVVFGELDWSYAVHEQATGRVFRDGQKDPVVAYYLLSDEGSDPVIQSTLGIKRMQLDGVRSPEGFEIAETTKTEGVLELARSVLARAEKKQKRQTAMELAAGGA